LAAAVLASTIVSDARLYADQRGAGVATNGYLTDTEILRLINQKLKGLYDLLLKARGQDYYIDEATIAISVGGGVSSSSSRYALPATFYQLKSVTLEWSANDHELVNPVNAVRGRAHYANSAGTWSRGSWKGYRLRGPNIEFLPTPTSSVTCRVQFVPCFTDLTLPSGSFDGVNGWEKLVAVGVAMEMLDIEEEGASARLQRTYDEELARIRSLAADRDADNPPQIEDVDPDGPGEPWYPTGGYQ
jgi:hypothetical protein